MGFALLVMEHVLIESLNELLNQENKNKIYTMLQ